MKTDKWRQELRCATCEHRLSFTEKMDSYGVCPYCGADDDSTVVDCTTHPYRLVATGRKWWGQRTYKRNYKA